MNVNENMTFILGIYGKKESINHSFSSFVLSQLNLGKSFHIKNLQKYTSINPYYIIAVENTVEFFFIKISKR